MQPNECYGIASISDVAETSPVQGTGRYELGAAVPSWLCGGYGSRPPPATETTGGRLF